MRLNCLQNFQIPRISRQNPSQNECFTSLNFRQGMQSGVILSRAQSLKSTIATTRWHPFMLLPSAPKEGAPKKEVLLEKFGPRAVQIEARMAETATQTVHARVFKGLGLDYDTDGLTGNTLDSHRLIYFAGKQGLDKQHNLVEELGTGYFTQGKYIGDREFLVEAANKVGVEGAAEFLEDPNNGLKEVTEEINKYSSQVSGVPHYVINGKYELSGGQPPEVFLRAFQAAASK
ncbi:hypothetical protein Sango_0053600 [Sesamum angolense]|uniref:DSBA-like thioredoxin domain-containing protein n=1 Tax=Sesamum angolense TaxID=2727404 RepID=A0AAE2C5J4_9LAMI|nr:hypothetical protein Sango_0053600 [Sesamum angolense]